MQYRILPPVCITCTNTHSAVHTRSLPCSWQTRQFRVQCLHAYHVRPISFVEWGARWLFTCDRWPHSIGSNTDHVMRLKQCAKRQKSDTDNDNNINYVQYKNAIIPFVSYECETRSLTVHSLTGTENTEVWRIYGLERNGWRERGGR